MPFTTVLFHGFWGLVAILLAELVRDGYHVLGHYYGPLMRLHNWHHRVYRKDFTPVSDSLYRQAHLVNDVPEALVMMITLTMLALATGIGGLWAGVVYSFTFLATAIARSRGWLITTDLTHEPGELTTPPSNWWVNRTYHWRHHFDDTNAYFSGSITLVDKILGTAVSLKGKTVAVTGASGALGQALLRELQQQKAKPIALTTTSPDQFSGDLPVWSWRPGAEAALEERLKGVDILVINHGVNVHGCRTPGAVDTSLEVNVLSSWRLMQVFFSTVHTSPQRANKEVWVNTSEAEVSPALSPLYEISKRLLGDLVTLGQLDAPCVVRRLILGPFKSQLNPIGILSADWVAWAVVGLAKRNVHTIIVTINPLTYLLFPLKEWGQRVYFKLFSRPD
ncbi:MAG: bifunctional sterol desaturase/short chain dehydrogenase [Nodosilinea sp.]